MSRPFIVLLCLLTSLGACTVAAQDPATCYENGQVDVSRTTQWQTARAAQDSGLMTRLAGNWSNSLSAFIDDVPSRVFIEQSLAANGLETTRATTCQVGSDRPCRVQQASGRWAASQDSDGTITLASRYNDGDRPGYCTILKVTLTAENQLLFAGTDGIFLNRN